jgi:hypothetical protein
VLSRVFLKFESASRSHFPLGAIGLPPAPLRSAAAPTFFFLPYRRAALPVSVRPRSCAWRLSPSPARANPTGAPAPYPTAGHRRPCHRGGLVRSDHPGRAPHRVGWTAGPHFGLGPDRAPALCLWAGTSAQCWIHFSFSFYLIKFLKLVQTSKIRRNL